MFLTKPIMILFRNIFICSFLFVSNLQAQSCDFDNYQQFILNKYPERKKVVEVLEKEIQEILDGESLIQYRTVLRIPVVVHIVWRNEVQNLSNEQIYAQLDALNRDFRKQNNEISNIPSIFKDLASDIEIEFCLVTETSDGQPFQGMTRTKTNIENIGQTNSIFSSINGGQDPWDTKHYLNIWVCEMDKKKLGYASSPGTADLEKDGVIINYRYFGLFGNSSPYYLGRTLTHEVGHFLNLKHPWGTIFGSCENTDFVDDTPLQKEAYYHCPQYPQESCGSIDMTMNFMQLVDDSCMSMFTKGQKERMLATLATTRQELVLYSSCEKITLNEENVSIILFPNPTENILNFNITSKQKETVIVKLINTMGQVCFQNEYKTNEYFYLNLKHLFPTGIYFFHVTSSSGELIGSIRKIIVNE
jgi:hypothetical protein